ncbi:MAG: hypothetical protein ACTS6G_02210 [Candidatus Hodgkinia cicadicola]
MRSLCFTTFEREDCSLRPLIYTKARLEASASAFLSNNSSLRREIDITH